MPPETIHPDDLRFITSLKEGDEAGMREFFYEELRPLLVQIRMRLFYDAVPYAELVDELYIHLASDGWRRLDTFSARHDSRLRTWVSQVAWRLFGAMREAIVPTEALGSIAPEEEPESTTANLQAVLDVRNTLARMPNRRYAEVLDLLLLKGYAPKEAAEKLGITVDNLYNVKHRAINQFISCFD